MDEESIGKRKLIGRCWKNSNNNCDVHPLNHRGIADKDSKLEMARITRFIVKMQKPGGYPAGQTDLNRFCERKSLWERGLPALWKSRVPAALTQNIDNIAKIYP